MLRSTIWVHVSDRNNDNMLLVNYYNTNTLWWPNRSHPELSKHDNYCVEKKTHYCTQNRGWFYSSAINWLSTRNTFRSRRVPPLQVTNRRNYINYYCFANYNYDGQRARTGRGLTSDKLLRCLRRVRSLFAMVTAAAAVVNNRQLLLLFSVNRLRTTRHSRDHNNIIMCAPPPPCPRPTRIRCYNNFGWRRVRVRTLFVSFQ